MNICFLGLEIIPAKDGAFVGGIANNVVRFAKGLAKRGHQIHIITSDVNSVFTASWGIPGISDAVAHGQNGLFVLSRNPEALANAILTLLNDKNLRRRRDQNARQLIVEEYSWDIVAKKIEKICRKAIKEVN